ncbi:hypothetical protein KY285_035657 [Solanum tuberosum]|nr:hypothetical protein KY285_035657 [Solanum tuberosum]
MGNILIRRSARWRTILGVEEEQLEDRVNFYFLMKRGESLQDDTKELKVNVNLSIIVRQIMGVLATEELDKRENLFHSRYKIMDKRSIPFKKLQCLNDSGEMKVLRRPWQFDRDVTHQGKYNKYSFLMDVQKYVLAPLTPYREYGDLFRVRFPRDYNLGRELELNCLCAEFSISQPASL